ncbi:MAG: copper homeostasis protein CutC [Bacteroidetes bacterium]|nr:copper homeostasis protein CutC [Bacteroidota bacterium]
MIVEIAVSTIESVRNAFEGGADRIELCSALPLGGLTPSAGFIEDAVAFGKMPVFAMIRPREGDFIYSDDELKCMLTDIAFSKKAGVHGIVSGVLNDKGEIDFEKTKQLVEASHPLPFTFHRAFDRTTDHHRSAEILIKAGVHRLLTSGMKAGAFEGKDVIRDLQQRYSKQLIILAGAGVNPSNVAKLVSYTGVQEVHLSASLKRKNSHSSKVSMGISDDGSYSVSDSDIVRMIKSETKQFNS